MLRLLTGAVVVGLSATATGCQSDDAAGALDVGGKEKAKAAAEGKVLASELLAYCPKVTLREGTAYFNTYLKGGDEDPAKLIYQASIGDVTRSCTRADGNMTINVAVAGKVVPGPAVTPGRVTMPIRIAVLRGTEVIYTQLHKYPVGISSTTTATQFVFNDPNVVIPIPEDQSLQVFAGYDEGPPKKKRAEDDDAF